MTFLKNWEQLESEYNKHYDPYADKCFHCGAEDSFEDDEDEAGKFWFCSNCGERVEVQ